MDDSLEFCRRAERRYRECVSKVCAQVHGPDEPGPCPTSKVRLLPPCACMLCALQLVWLHTIRSIRTFRSWPAHYGATSRPGRRGAKNSFWHGEFLAWGPPQHVKIRLKPFLASKSEATIRSWRQEIPGLAIHGTTVCATISQNRVLASVIFVSVTRVFGDEM